MLAEITQDDIAVSVACAIAVANKRARELGIDVLQSLITITQHSSNGNDPKISNAFDRDLLALLTELNYVVITVVLDKKEHKEQYRVWRYDPYNYYLRILVERFVLFLETENAVGAVMSESRGGKEDIHLKKSFKRIYE